MGQIPIKKANEISHGSLMAFKVCRGAAQMSLKSWFIRMWQYNFFWPVERTFEVVVTPIFKFLVTSFGFGILKAPSCFIVRSVVVTVCPVEFQH